MADNFRYAQLQPFALAGAGISIGATTITLQEFLSIDGTPLTMAAFGTIGYGTLEPNSFQREEQVSFTGITQNLNGTATLTGVKTVNFLYPYTEAAGVTKSHPGGATFVITNTSGFYNTFTNKNDDETILGAWVLPGTEPIRPKLTVDVDATDATSLITYGQLSRAVFGAVPSASTTVNGTVELATASELAAGTAVGGTGAFLVPANSSFNNTPGSQLVPVSTTNQIINQAWVDILFTTGEAIDASVTPQAVYLKESDGKIYKADATAYAENLFAFVGFVTFPQNLAINTTARVRTWGLVDGFGGTLTLGAYYYITDATGTIGTTPGTKPYQVGRAQTTSVLLIEKGIKRAIGRTIVTITASQTITCGFKPTKVHITCWRFQTQANQSIGSWQAPAVNSCIRLYSTDGSSSIKAWSVLDGAGNQHEGVVDNITSTTFDLNNASAGAPGTSQLYWEAEG